MIPLIFIALGLGVALTAYEFSPRTHARVDDYARAIRSAYEAHDAAEAHLANASASASTASTHARAADGGGAHHAAAQTATEASVDHAAAATAANQAAAQRTADAAKSARTADERGEVAQSAAQVLLREKKIAQALASLGAGQCGVRLYAGVTPQVVGKLLARLHVEGMAVAGDNPWDIETNQYGVRLRAVWDPQTLGLKLVVVTGEGGYFGLVTCEKIWERIDPILKGVLGG